MIASRLPFLLLLGTAVSIAFFWAVEIPLGVPGEWTWPRIRVESGRMTDLLLGICVASVAATFYVGFARFGARRMARCGRSESAGWLAGLVMVGFFWLTAVQNSPPGDLPQLKSTWVLYDPGSSGYFFEAAHGIRDLPGFLSGYEDRMAEGDVLHVGTHPPGLFVMHYGLIQLCRSSPGFSRLILQTQPRSTAEAFSAVERSFRGKFPRLPAADRAALWLASLFTQLLGAATVIPLFLLLKRHYSRQTCWKAAVLWPLVPALAIFLPKSDALYPFLGTLFLWLWQVGNCRKSIRLAALAGLVFWMGLFLSLAMLPVAVLAAFLTAWEFRFGNETQQANGRHRNLFLQIAAAGAGFLLPVILLWFAWDLNLLKTWLQNYRNHAAFYDQFTRTYWKWLLVNPLELMFAIGLPLVIAIGTSMMRKIRGEPLESSRAGFCIGCFLVWGLLWLSGKNMGEAARLWLFLMPCFVGMTAAFPDDRDRRDLKSELSPGSLQHFDGWLLLIVLQTVVCIATVSRVSGFHFGRF